MVNVDSAEGNAAKLTKFMYTTNHKLVLLKCIREVDAHRAAQGESDNAFEKVLSSFVSIVPA